MAKNGSEVVVAVNVGTPAVPAYEEVGSQRDVTFDEATEAIDVSSKDSRAARVLPGRYSSSVSLDTLYVWTDNGYRALRDAMRDGDLILIARNDEGVTIEYADALVTSLSESFPDQGEAAVSLSLDIDGFWSELVS